MERATKKRPFKKLYDLEERTELFAVDVRVFVRRIPYSLISVDDIRQLVRSSGSIGANYIEANGALGKKDFQMRMRICKKETRESSYWLRLLSNTTKGNSNLETERKRPHVETKELERIFGAILIKSTSE